LGVKLEDRKFSKSRILRNIIFYNVNDFLIDYQAEGNDIGCRKRAKAIARFHFSRYKSFQIVKMRGFYRS